MTIWVGFCKMPGTPRGMYDEEIDVEARTRNEAKKKIEKVLADDYEPGMRVVKIVDSWHAGGFVHVTSF